MRKAKRLIALITVAMFILSFAAPGAFAASFSDVSGDNSKAIYRLNSLGIINGYPDGTFKPANQITRAEYAVIAMSAAGLAKSADILKDSASKFKDVKPGDWYAGWVNLAASQGYIAGYPDGTFKPNANITYAECITILMRILGYDANLPGVWPTEYIVKAAELGVTDNVKFSASAPATRGDIAILTSATLDENLVTWDKDKDVYVDKYAAARTLFEDKFDGYSFDEDGLMVTNWGVDNDGLFTITVDSLNDEDPLTGAAMTGTKTLTVAKNAVVVGVNLVSDLKDHLIEFDYNTDDKEVTYINVTSKTVKGQNDSTDTSLDKIKNPTATNIEIDGKTYRYADGYSQAIDKYVDSDGYFKFCLNKDGEIYKVSKYGSPSYQIVEEYNTTSQKLSFKNSIGAATGTLTLKDKDVLVTKGGKIAKVEDIKKGDVISVSTNVTGLDYHLDVKAVNKSGKVEAFYGVGQLYSAVKIDGAKYYLRSDALISTDDGDNFATVTNAKLDDVDGISVKYYLDSANKVALIISDKEAENNVSYGIITEVLDETLKGEVTKVKMLKNNNTEIEYAINVTELKVDWTYNPGSGELSPATPNSVDVTLSGYGDWEVKYTLDATGKIDDIDLLTSGRVNLDQAIKASNKIITDGGANYYLDANTVILNGRGINEDAAVESNTNLLKWLEDSNNGTLNVWMKVDGNKVKYITLNTDLGVSAENYALVVDKYKSGGKVWITVDVRGTRTSYESTDSSDAYYTGLKVDDVSALYSYTMSGTKLSIDLVNDVYPHNLSAVKEVYEKDSVNKSIRVGVNEWYEIDADTYIYDLTGSEPVYVSDFANINVGDNVRCYVLNINDDDDRVGVIDVLFIVD